MADDLDNYEPEDNEPVTPDTVEILHTADLTTFKYPDSAYLTLQGGRQGETLVRPLGGRYLAAAQRGNVFIGAGVVAGVTIPAQPTTANVTSTAGIMNPPGSGVVVEIVGIQISSTQLYNVNRFYVLGFQLNATDNGRWPTSITKLTTTQLAGPPRNAKAFTYSSAVFNSGDPATTLDAGSFGVFQSLIPLHGRINTQVGYVPTTQEYSGELLIPPNTASAILSVNFSHANDAVTFIWSEWPL